MNKKLKYTSWPVALLAWSFIALVGAQLPAQQLGLNFQRLDRDKGLSQGTCPFVSRDSRGFVWIATIDGLNRFDGQTVKVYRPNAEKKHSLVGNILTSACFEDAKGDLWFTTYNAVHRYVRDFDHFDTFQLKNTTRQPLVEDYYAFHLDSLGQLWLRVGSGEAGYLHVFNTRTGQDSILCRINGYRTSVLTSASGQVQQLFCSVLKLGMEVIDLKPGYPTRRYFMNGDLAGPIYETYVESDTLVWLGMANGIAAFNPKTGASLIYSTFDGQAAGKVWSVCPYGRQLLFVATEESGLWVFDRQTRRFTQQFKQELGNAFSLADNEVKNLYIDRQENLWVAHWKYGLSYVNLRKNKFSIPPGTRGCTFWQFQTGPDGNVWCSVPEKGIFIFSPDGRLLDTLDNFIPEQKRRIKILAPLYFPQGGRQGIYFNYLLEWNQPKHRLELKGRLPFRMLDYCTTPSGRTIMVTATQILQLNRDEKEGFSTSPFDLAGLFPLNNISAIFADSRGYVYVSENSERLLIFKETPQGLVFRKSIAGAGACKGFYEKPDAQGVLVAGTAGLLSIDSKLSARILNENSDGLPNATYYGVISDGQGRVWLSSNQGLVCYNPTQRNSRRYLPVDGLFGPEFNTGAFYQAPDGKIWAGGPGGMVIFHPDSIRDVPFVPQVQFTQIRINDGPLDAEKQPEVLEALDLEYDKNTLSFEFVALEFSNPSVNQFKYRLVGYDDDWVYSGTRGFARYANLPHNQYTFEVLAANSDGIWSTEPKRLKINIQTPYYQSWWFYLLCALTVSGLIYAWFQYRLQQALKIERMRVQISSDLHDDVGTLLSGLAMQSEVLELTAPEKDRSKLRRISEMSRDAMGRMRDTVWAIDARKDKFENLLDRMREHAEETLPPAGIQFRIDTGKLNLKKNLPTHIRQNLYLIYKEAVTNAAKHSKGNRLTVRFEKSEAGFEMWICDNGTVKEKGYKTTGSGTSNMQMRAEKIGGVLEIRRSAAGFCVLLQVKSLG